MTQTFFRFSGWRLAALGVVVVTGLMWPGLAMGQAAAPAVTPVPQSLPSPDGGLFTKTPTRASSIHFPNLIGRFTSGDFLSNIFDFTLDLFASFGGIVAFGYIIYGGVKMIISGGNPAQFEEGKKMIIGSVVGILMISLAYVVVLFIQSQLN